MDNEIKFLNRTPLSSQNIYNMLMFRDTPEGNYTGNAETQLQSGFKILSLVVRIGLDIYTFLLMTRMWNAPDLIKQLYMIALTAVAVLIVDRLVSLYLKAMLKRIRKNDSSAPKKGSLFMIIDKKPVRIRFDNVAHKNRQLVELMKKRVDPDIPRPDESECLFEFSEDSFTMRNSKTAQEDVILYKDITRLCVTEDYVFFDFLMKSDKKRALAKPGAAVMERSGFTVGTDGDFCFFMREKLGEKYTESNYQSLQYMQ